MNLNGEEKRAWSWLISEGHSESSLKLVDLQVEHLGETGKKDVASW